MKESKCSRFYFIESLGVIDNFRRPFMFIFRLPTVRLVPRPVLYLAVAATVALSVTSGAPGTKVNAYRDGAMRLSLN